MAVQSLGQLTVDLVANTAGFERGMNQSERALKSLSKEAAYQGTQLEKLVGQIDPVAGALNRLDAQQQKLDAHFKAGRLPLDDYQKYTKILDDQKASAEKTATAFGKVDRAMAANGQTLKQYNNNLRGIPAQFTDIVVSLQGGQKPLTVLIQQGGQLKDMFGGVGPALRAVGGYALGLVNPITLAAGAVAVLAVAYAQGSAEGSAFNAALITTGNAAGTTAAQLGNNAQEVSKVVGTVGAAAAVLAQLAAAGTIPRDSFDMIAIAALKMQEATGKAAEETIKDFTNLAKDPVKYSKELNDSMNYLTATQYAHIDALVKQNDTQGAANIAEQAYAEALTKRADKIVNDLGYVEGAWLTVKNAAKSAWDSILDIGREDTFEQKLKVLQDRLQAIRDNTAANNVPGNGIAPDDSIRREATEKQITDLLVQQEESRKRAAAIGKAAAEQKLGITAVEALNKGLDDSAPKAEKLRKALALLDKQIADAAKAGVAYTPKQVEQLRTDTKDKFKEADPKPFQEDAGQKMLNTLREQNAALQAQFDTNDKLGTQAQALARFQQQIADIKSKDNQTTDQKALLASEDLIVAQLKRNVLLEQEVDAKKKSNEESKKLTAFNENVQSKLSGAQDQLNTQLAGAGLGSKDKSRLKEDLAIQKDYQNQQDKLESEHNKGQISDDLYAKETSTLKDALAERLVMQQDYYNQTDEASKNFFNGASEAWANYADTAQNYSQQAAEFVTGTLDGLTSSTATFLDSILRGTSSVGDAFAQLGLSMLNSIIGALEKMAAQWIVYQAVQLLTGKATQASAATTLIANAQATAFQASLAAFASTAAIPIVGPFLAPAAAATAASFAAPLVAGVASTALAGMAHDGIDSVPADGTWLLQKGERVTTAQTSAKLDKTLNDIKSPSSGGVVVNQIEDSSRAGQTSMREEDGQKFIDLWISKLYSDDDVMTALSRKTGVRAVGS